MFRYTLLTLVLVLLSSIAIATGEDKLHKTHTIGMSTAEDKRTKWPEYVGQSGEEVQKSLKAAHPDWKVDIVPENSMVTMDYREDRVRIWVDGDGKCAKAPTIG